MIMQFDAATRVGAVTLAALRMWQQSSPEQRRPFADIVTIAHTSPPLSPAAIDAVCEGMAHGGALLIDTALQAKGTRALRDDETAGGAAGVGPIVFFAARDGESTYGVLAAGDLAEAEAEALAEARAQFGLEGDDNDTRCELDGFAVWQPLGTPLPAPSPRELAMAEAIGELLNNRDHLELHADDRAMLAEAAGMDDGGAMPWRVTLFAEGIEITAHDESAARRHALSDAREFMAQHRVTVEEVEPGDAEDVGEEVEVEVECTRGEHTEFTFTATYTVTVLCPEDDAEATARDVLANGGGA